MNGDDVYVVLYDFTKLIIKKIGMWESNTQPKPIQIKL